MLARQTRLIAAVLGTVMLVAGVAPAAALAAPPADSGPRAPSSAAPVSSAPQPDASADAAPAAAIGTEFAVQYARFYPRKDDYRDTDTISGTTLVPATVTIRIYTSGGTRIKSFLLGAQEGAYSVVWNGRRKDGSLFPQGTYTVKQYVTAEGTAETATHTIVLSHKRVYWYLGSQTRYADSGALFFAGDGIVAQYTDGMRAISLMGGYVEGGYAMGRYTFTLPSAHVYASLRVSIYGTGATNGDGHETHDPGYAGIRNFETGEVEWIREVGYEWAWYSSSVAGEDHVTSDRKAQAWALAGEGAILNYEKVKLTYKYGILDY